VNTIQLQTPTGEPVNIFVCGKCGVIYGANRDIQAKEFDQQRADRCCTPVPCCQCRQPTTTLWREHIAGSTCDECAAKERTKKHEAWFASAVKHDATTYEGWVYSENHTSHHDGYFESVEAFVDWLWDQSDDNDEQPRWPDYALTCKSQSFHLDLSYAISNECDDFYEDAADHIKGEKELQIAVDAFNAANKSVVVWETDGGLVFIPSFAATKAVFEGKANQSA
jgi:hypothetical protein